MLKEHYFSVIFLNKITVLKLKKTWKTRHNGDVDECPSPEPTPESSSAPELKCGKETESLNGICQVVSLDVKQNSTSNNQENFNFFK